MLKRMLLVGGLSWVLGAVGCGGGAETASDPQGTGGSGPDAGMGSNRDSAVGGSSGEAGPMVDATVGCKMDADCTAKVPPAMPAGCVTATCDTARGSCVFSAKDRDGDGHKSNTCKASDGTPVVIGDDCNDTDPTIYTSAWDGPVGDGHAASCDGIDQDCDGLADNEKLADGTSCTCMPNDVRDCSQDSGGRPITWPSGKPIGACKFGSQTCLMDGTWGPCTGAVSPSTEICNKVDDDCNGVVDDGPAPDHVPVDAIYFAYDGDNDQHARIVGSGYAQVHACSFNPPATAPSACVMGSLAGCALGTTVKDCCPPTAWKFAGSLQSDDCNDENPKVNPTAPEICDGLDNDCNTTPDEGCVCKPNEMDNQCSAAATGSPITWPKGAPVGSCKYGTRTCSSDGKSWGPCNGAIAPAQQDNCAVAGNDDSCNGVSNDSCACVQPASQMCGSDVGSCVHGTSTCQASGTFGPCLGGTQPKTQDTCDTGNDDNCDGSPNNGFPSNKTVCHCLNGQTQACGACLAGSQTCVNGAFGTCLGAPGNVGQKCDVAGKTEGACVKGGTMTCDPNNLSVPTCKPDAVGIGQDYTDQGGDPAALTAAPNGSFDWNCDGTVETSYPEPPFNVFDSCGNNGSTWCGDWWSGTDKSLCENGSAPFFLNPGGSCGLGSCTPARCDFGAGVACGQKLIVVNCQWNAGNSTCSNRIAPSLTPYPEGCQ
jgi:hypothetical protein